MLGENDPNLEFDRKTNWQRFGVPALGAVAAVAAVSFAIVWLRDTGPAPRPHKEQPRILNIKLPPPPPPPPPKQEPPKPEEKKEIKAETPKQQTPKPPPEPSPGLTAKVGNGPDAFGLAAGNGEGDVGGGGGGNAEEFANYYKSAIVNRVQGALSRSDRLRDAEFRLTVAITFDQNGRATRVSVQDFQGNADDRAEVERILSALSVNENMPAEMTGGRPWLVRIRAREPG